MFKLQKNVGTIDRIIRVILGLTVFVLGVYYKSWWGVLGIFPFLTGSYGWCWIYRILGMSTMKKT